MSQNWGEHGALREANCVPTIGIVLNASMLNQNKGNSDITLPVFCRLCAHAVFLITNATQKPTTQYLGVSASNPNKSARTSGAPSLEEASVFDRPTCMMWFHLPSICRWAEQADVHSDRSRSTAMTPHSDLVHFLLEMYASQGVSAAKPLSECGQGLPVYAWKGDQDRR